MLRSTDSPDQPADWVIIELSVFIEEAFIVVIVIVISWPPWWTRRWWRRQLMDLICRKERISRQRSW